MEPDAAHQAGTSSTDSVESMAVGSYLLESLRSRHGDYEVWTAVHQPTEMEVVMDVYPKSGDDKKLVVSVVHKIDLFTSLAQAKVLRLLEVMDSSVAIFLVYEFYGAQSLQHYVLNCPIGGKEFHRLVHSLIKIVHGLHRHCFFHGTLNADSFVLTRQKKIKFKDAPSCHAFLRSQAEPARFDAILSKASDVWSVGALIYQLIAHQVSSGLAAAFTGGPGIGTGTGTVAQVVSQMDADLSDLLSRMTDQNPTARISTADCLRHPYLTRTMSGLPQSRAATRLRASSSDSRRINLDIVRFLSRATGAPVADLAAAADANDLSGWCSAYWLMKQRLATGRGYPTLAAGDSDSDAGQQVAGNGGASANPGKSSETRIASQQQQPAMKASAASSAAPPAAARGHAGFRGTIALLRGRRLGLASPRGTDHATPMTSVEARRLQLPQPPFRDRDSLPPITVRSAGNSERTATQRSASEQHQESTDRRQLQRLRQPDVASRYLSYIRRQQEELSAVKAEPPTADDSGDASSAIRIRIQQRREAETPQERQKQQQRHQRRQQNQTATMPTLSPRQPPNSRTDIGRPRYQPDDDESSARPKDDADANLEVADVEQSPPPQLFLWDTALVRWPQWVRSRAVCS